MRDIRFTIALLLIGKCLTEGAPFIPLPFLRGGSATTAARTMKKQQQTQRRHSRLRRHHHTRSRGGGGVNPIGLVANNLKQGIGKVGDKIQHDTATLGKNIGREWDKITSNTRKFVADIPKILPNPLRRKKLKSCKKLDDVCHTFASVLRGNNEVDTAQLLKACRAHLTFMKSGGPSLKLVAKDLESNLHKAEKVYKKSPKEGKCLSSLLECEKNRGIHNGNQLQEKSAAMGLLWIRRSLAFQLDLYASLIHGQVHPREAAYNAYSKHLSPFHGWALRKVFPASLSQMPDRQVFMAKFGGIDVDELNDEIDRVIAKKLKVLVSTWDPLLSSWKDEFERLDLEDTRKV